MRPASVANPIGVGIGFLLPPSLVSEPSDIPFMLIIEAALISAISLPLFLFLRHVHVPLCLVRTHVSLMSLSLQEHSTHPTQHRCRQRRRSQTRFCSICEEHSFWYSLLGAFSIQNASVNTSPFYIFFAESYGAVFLGAWRIQYACNSHQPAGRPLWIF